MRMGVGGARKELGEKVQNGNMTSLWGGDWLQFPPKFKCLTCYGEVEEVQIKNENFQSHAWVGISTKIEREAVHGRGLGQRGGIPKKRPRG
jgi:hypothetical protein